MGENDVNVVVEKEEDVSLCGVILGAVDSTTKYDTALRSNHQNNMHIMNSNIPPSSEKVIFFRVLEDSLSVYALPLLSSSFEEHVTILKVLTSGCILRCYPTLLPCPTSGHKWIRTTGGGWVLHHLLQDLTLSPPIMSYPLSKEEHDFSWFRVISSHGTSVLANPSLASMPLQDKVSGKIMRLQCGEYLKAYLILKCDAGGEETDFEGTTFIKIKVADVSSTDYHTLFRSSDHSETLLSPNCFGDETGFGWVPLISTNLLPLQDCPGIEVATGGGWWYIASAANVRVFIGPSFLAAALSNYEHLFLGERIRIIERISFPGECGRWCKIGSTLGLQGLWVNDSDVNLHEIFDGPMPLNASYAKISRPLVERKYGEYRNTSGRRIYPRDRPDLSSTPLKNYWIEAGEIVSICLRYTISLDAEVTFLLISKTEDGCWSTHYSKACSSSEPSSFSSSSMIGKDSENKDLCLWLWEPVNGHLQFEFMT